MINLLTGEIKLLYVPLMKHLLNKLYHFRYTYYCLKLKKHFKRWLWERIREPKIMKRFHPDHLNALNETDDLENFIEDWINNNNNDK
jgi:hypothetical protein